MTFVIISNINTPIDKIVDYVTNIRQPYTKLVLLTSHSLFKSEKAILLNLIKCEIVFINFGSFNSTNELLDIDSKAYSQSKNTLDYHSLYINTFKRNLIFQKNKFIYDQVKCLYPKAKYTVFCNKFDTYNLGISHLFWRNKATIIGSDSFLQSINSDFRNLLNFGKIGLVIYYIKALYFALKPTKFYSVNHNNYNWIFPSLYRVKLSENDVSSKYKIPIVASLNKKNKLSIGLHESGKLLNAHPIIPKNKIHVIGDAYRPSNYPPYLFALLFKGVKYVAKYDTDKAFFQKNGIDIITKKPSFLKKENIFNNYKSIPISVVRTVILSINHTGDWTALLSRSDTDIIISSFVEVSQRFKNTNFIVRLHPTMDNKTAEGQSSKMRIRHFINKLDHANLSVSNLSMEEDWDRGDVFISEYSLSVIDAINKGKVGIFYNLTNRLSFVRDLLNKGIYYCTNEKDLINKLSNLISH